jgi:hypothetical protein
MTRLYIFAEGQTEQTYADTVLKRHLAAFGVYVQGPVLIAHTRRRRVTHRGGGHHYEAMKADIVRFLRQEKADDVFFTTMIDLYAIAKDFPGIEAADRLRHLPYERVKKLEEGFAADISDPYGRPSRLIPYIQVHEFEAVLFSQPQAFSAFFDNCGREVEALKKIVQECGEPELIDDGSETAPSKRIARLFPDYEGAKPTYGPLIAEEIGIAAVRGRCPHFDAWLKRLESLSHS